MRTPNAARLAFLVATVILLGGCLTTSDSGRRDVARRDTPIDKARALYDAGRYTQAMIACIDAGKIDPDMEGLDDLQADISEALWQQRARSAAIRSAGLAAKMETDAEAHKTLPDSYRVQRGVVGDTAPLRTAPTEMDRVLQRPVTVHLDNVTLSEFILAIGEDENINIIADTLDNTKTMTLHAEDVPLQEILDYVSRNLAVTFSVGRNMIWATQADATEPRLPMETRMYRLRKGLSSEEIEGGPDSLGILDAIQRFVPETEGADMLFNEKAHLLIVRNTRDNLSRVEDIIEALDISPPQVLIEARFISTSITDLRELGIDWVLNSAVGVTSEDVVRNGSVASANSTEITDGSIGFTSFASEAGGLNLTYSGVLTDPMFEAVVHALETSGRSRTLSVPKVTTVNNRPATIRIGEDFRYFEEYDTEEILVGTTDEGREIYTSRQVPVGSPSLEELGIQLDVTPSVGADLQSVTLRMTPEIKDFVRWEYWEVASDSRTSTGSTTDTTTTTNGTETSTIKLPVFRVSRIETEVVVQTGETVVMGGLISSSETKDEEKVPILSSIPLIGNLFRHDITEVVEHNLLIFVTATIISERGESLVPLAADRPQPAAPALPAPQP
jgi:type IV pilus assembly protein PilQ